MYRFVDVIPKKEINNSLSELFEVRRRIAEKNNEPFVFHSPEELAREYYNEHNSPERGLRGIIYNNSDIAGYYHFVTASPNMTREKEMLQLSLLEEEWNDELIDALKEKSALYTLDSDGIYIIAPDSVTEGIAKAMSGKMYSENIHFFLANDAFNEEYAEEVLERVPDENPDISMKFFEMVSKEFVREYAELFTNLICGSDEDSESEYISEEEIMLYNEQAVNMGGTIYIYLLFNPKDDIIGMTNVFVPARKLPAKLYQFMTGIRKDYRGRKLAHWLKVKMIEKLKEDFPDFVYIVTENHPNNKAIIRINEKMGFKRKFSSRIYRVEL